VTLERDGCCSLPDLFVDSMQDVRQVYTKAHVTVAPDGQAGVQTVFMSLGWQRSGHLLAAGWCGQGMDRGQGARQITQLQIGRQRAGDGVADWSGVARRERGVIREAVVHTGQQAPLIKVEDVLAFAVVVAGVALGVVQVLVGVDEVQIDTAQAGVSRLL
jgi:hypothetical protein